MPATPDLKPVSLEDFDPERDLKPVADFVDQYLGGAEGEPEEAAGQPEEPGTGEGADTLIREVTDEMAPEERSSIISANKQAVQDNPEAFIPRLKEVGPPSQWSGAVASSMGAEMKKALTRAWGYLDQAQRNEVKAAFEGKMNKGTDNKEPMDEEPPVKGGSDNYSDYDAEVQKMLSESAK